MLVATSILIKRVRLESPVSDNFEIPQASHIGAAQVVFRIQ